MNNGGNDMEICMTVLEVLGHFVWQGAVVGLAVLLCRWLMGGASSRVRYRVGLVAMGVMVMCVVCTSVWVGVKGGDDGVAAGSYDVREIGVVGEVDVASGVSGEMDGAYAADWDGEVNQNSAGNDEGEGQWMGIVVAVYVVGVVLMIGRVVVGCFGGRRLRRRAKVVSDVKLIELLKRGADEMGMKCVPVLMYCERVVVPVVVGVVRPAILLPLSMASELSVEQIEAVLMHELAHVRRLDHVVVVVQRVIEAVLFYHPAVWYVSRWMNVERERCCDDMVVSRGGVDRLRYADALLRVIEICKGSSGNSGGIGGGVGWGRGSERDEVARDLLAGGYLHALMMRRVRAVSSS